MVPASARRRRRRGLSLFADARITESSGLVDLGSVMGHDQRLRGQRPCSSSIDPATGRTVGVTDFHANVVDVEALAPAGRQRRLGGRHRGQRRRARSPSASSGSRSDRAASTSPRALPPRLPTGRPNAESLFVDRLGRLHVITKSFVGGVVYRAPARLSTTRPNRLQPSARVQRVRHRRRADPRRPPRHRARAGAAPASTRSPASGGSASFALPRQPQGEGISVGPTGAGPGEQRGRPTPPSARSVFRRPWPRRIGPPGPRPRARRPVRPPSPSPEPRVTPTPHLADPDVRRLLEDGVG